MTLLQRNTLGRRKLLFFESSKRRIFDARIYMNNILDYEGYRFFQSSFDPDEKGTVLSVSHDFGEQLLLMLVIYVIFCYDVNYVYKTLSFVDLQKKLEVVKRKIEVSYRFGFSNEYEQFCPDS
jgi:hypothetical protein